MRECTKEGRMLNDVQTGKRLAYLLGPTLERYQGRGRPRRAVRLAILGAIALLLFFLWELSGFKGH